MRVLRNQLSRCRGLFACLFLFTAAGCDTVKDWTGQAVDGIETLSNTASDVKESADSVTTALDDGVNQVEAVETSAKQAMKKVKELPKTVSDRKP